MKRKLFFIILCFLFTTVINAQPPNNAIFNGGAGDGSIFVSFTGASNNIFFGGTGDGWHFNNNIVTTNSIFLGGIGDGWHNNNFNLAPNNIFNGGIGDGWHNNNFSPAPNNIFNGGEGDGWAKVIYPLGPLPVTLLSFTGEQQGKTILLKWQTSQEINTSHFELERSADANSFMVIKTVIAAGTSSLAKNYLSVDEFPLSGNNFYRLKMVDADGKYTYSNIVLLKLLSNDVMLSVFPNPAANKLNIAIRNITNIAQIQVQVFDNAGKLIAQQSVYNNNGITLDVSKFASGVYLLKIIYSGKEETIRFVKAQ
ncbi:MAG TPA: T9SS type A sorting domain-containing protein [Ferruginibacter sp.]|nr:T9SS type A sorting domain-containing protein [Ferruginibacter sp.]